MGLRQVVDGDTPRYPFGQGEERDTVWWSILLTAVGIPRQSRLLSAETLRRETSWRYVIYRTSDGGQRVRQRNYERMIYLREDLWTSY